MTPRPEQGCGNIGALHVVCRRNQGAPEGNHCFPLCSEVGSPGNSSDREGRVFLVADPCGTKQPIDRLGTVGGDAVPVLNSQFGRCFPRRNRQVVEAFSLHMSMLRRSNAQVARRVATRPDAHRRTLVADVSHATLDRVLAVLVVLMAATGLLSLRAGAADTAWVFTLHAVLGGSLLAATLVKLRRSIPKATAPVDGDDWRSGSSSALGSWPP